MIALTLPIVSASATEGVYLPPAPRGPGGEDTIETAGGTRCSQSINNNGAYLDVGMAGSAASPLPEDRPFTYTQQRDANALVYARVTIPLGKRPERIDCSRVYELEIERLREEVAMLRMGAE